MWVCGCVVCCVQRQSVVASSDVFTSSLWLKADLICLTYCVALFFFFIYFDFFEKLLFHFFATFTCFLLPCFLLLLYLLLFFSFSFFFLIFFCFFLFEPHTIHMSQLFSAQCMMTDSIVTRVLHVIIMMHDPQPACQVKVAHWTPSTHCAYFANMVAERG